MRNWENYFKVEFPPPSTPLIESNQYSTLMPLWLL